MNNFSIILALIVFTFFGCIEQDRTNNQNDIKPEDFNDFLTQFNKDSVFQKTRVNFPFLQIVMVKGADVEEIEKVYKKNWSFRDYSWDSSYAKKDMDAYTQKIVLSEDTAKLEYRGVDNCIYFDVYFAKIDGKWFCIKSYE